MKVAFPLHASTEQRPALTALWSNLRARLEADGFEGLPAEVDFDATDESLLGEPSLLLAQVSGFALRKFAIEHTAAAPIAVLGRPTYRAEGADVAALRGIVIVPSVESVSSLGGLRGAVAALDSRTSDTGYNVFRATIAPYSRNGTYFASVIETGSPFKSVEFVAAGRADVACVDGVTLAIMQKSQPDTVRRIRRLMGTDHAPSSPFVTAQNGALAEALGRALCAVSGDPDLAALRESLYLDEISAPDAAHDDAVAALEDDAKARDYPEIR
jgi:ABC-type phosphate/phosphonate transport system substrate-binding protein